MLARLPRAFATLALICAASLPAGPAEAAPPSSAARTTGQLVGQTLMGRVNGTVAGGELLRRVRRGQVGGVILFSDNVRTRRQTRLLIATLQRAAARGGQPPLLVAVDQEGGLVRRLPWAAPTVSAAAMGRASRPAQAARAQGRRSAASLARDGFNVNLAPVADVPAVHDSFLGTRAFGRTPAAVATAACAFADGLTAGGRVAATLKHFPGLGAAGANTDFTAVTIRAPLSQLRRSYRPYTRCARAPLRLVMLSSAGYAALTGSTPAVLSSVIYRRELRRVGFAGATISDDLEADALRGRRQVTVRAARAGLDIQLYARTERGSARAFRDLIAAVRGGRVSRARVAQAARRVAELKTQLGLTPAS